MADRTADYVITLGGDDAPLRAIVNSFKSSFRSAASDIEAASAKIELFKNVEQQVKDASAAFFKATDAAAKFRQQIAQIEGSGGTVGKELTAALAATEKQVTQTSKEFNKQATQLDKLRASLTSAGVDTKNLATEQTRLAAALQAQQRADADRNAAQVLGIKLTKDQTAEIQRQYAAFNTLRANGLASSKDIAAAQTALTANVKAATASVKEGAVAAEGFGSTLKSGLAGAVLPFVGITAAIGAVTAAFKGAIEASHEFHQALAEIGTVTKLTKEQLDRLGEGVRQVALATSTDLNAALKATFDLLRSGVPEGNVLEVLKISAEAAKAGLTDVGTGAKAANLLLDAFGAQIADLPLLFDKIIAGAHNGGATFKEFAESAGPLLNVARSTGQEFDSVLAVLTVLVDKSSDAGKSFSDLTKILQKIGTAEARANLLALGITSTDVVEIFRQLGERGKTLEDVLALGLAAGGAKSAAAMATLTNNTRELPDVLNAVVTAANEVKKSNEALFDTPTERAKRFSAEVNQAAVSLGNLIGPGSRAAALATRIVHEFNQIPAAFEAAGLESDKAGSTFESVAAALLQIDPAAANAKAALGGVAAVADAAAKAAKAIEVDINRLRTTLAALAPDLLASVKSAQDALTRDLADIQARSDAQISLLDRGRQAEAATAAATLAIQLQAAKDKLAAIQASEKAITEALAAAQLARSKGTKAAGETDQKVEAATNAARLQAIGQTLAAYQQLYASLVTIAQAAFARVQGFEEARISVAQSVEDAIRAVRFDALTGLDQYVARMAEIDRLVSEGRKKAAEGDTAAAKQFFEQAITESKSLTKVVSESGVVVITATQAQTDKLNKLKGIQDASNKAFFDQADAAREGGDKTNIEIEKVADKITELQGTYDALKATIAEGLKVKVETDDASVRAAFATLEELTKPRTVTITVETVNKGDFTPEQRGGSGSFRAGGLVRGARTIARNLNRGGEVVRGFARGGPVFRTPSWMKVPGTGSGDTVPARLRAGSYVVRQAASRYYGDGLMGAIARGAGVRGYAAGGTVTKDEIVKWAEKLFGGKDPFGLLGGKPTVGPGAGGGFPSQGQFPGQGQFPAGTGGLRDKDIQKGVHPPISFDTRPIPEELITAINVLTYAREMLNAVGQTNPLLGDLLPAITQGITRVENNPADKTALTALLRDAETIGSNPYIFAMWERTSSSIAKVVPTWFVDWLTKRGLLDPSGNITKHGTSVDVSGFAAKFFGSTDFAQRLLGGSGFAQKFFNSQRGFAGGGGVDSVPAWLTPEEWVIKPKAVAKYGTAFMHGINTMAIPRSFVANMMAPPMPVSRFAEGGQVGGDRTAFAGGPGNVERSATINVNANAGDILSETNARRFLWPVLRDALRTGEIKVPTR